MVHLTPIVYSSDIEWVDELSGESFEALLIYSLCLWEEYEIDAYFSEKMDVLDQQDGLLCYSMAVRLYFEGFIQSALDGIKSAVTYGFKEPELFVLQGLCFRKKGMLQQADRAFNRAYALNPVYTVDREYRELDLLIFYEDGKDSSR